MEKNGMEKDIPYMKKFKDNLNTTGIPFSKWFFIEAPLIVPFTFIEIQLILE